MMSHDPRYARLVLRRPLPWAKDPMSFDIMAKRAFDYRSLSVAERLELVGDIWDSIADEANASPELLPLSEGEKAELDRRVAEHDADPAAAAPLDQALDRIRARIRRK